MQSVLFFDYFATGEGRTIEIFYTNSSRMDDEEAIEKWKNDHDPYFHVGLEVISVEDILDNRQVMETIKVHTPALFNYLEGERDYVFKCDYKAYFNYS